MDSREILELENKLLDPTTEEPISLPLHFLRSITNDFSNEQELGRGGYGVVYKGRLLYHGDSFIAVKKFHDSHVVNGDEQFQKVATSLIKHPNVTQLLGYCSESKGEMIKLPNGKYVIADKQTRILCFEYMCNEGLDKHLSALECVHPEKEKRPNVSNIIEILNAAEGSCVQNGEDLLVDHQL
ncbi:unnamed protein product [Miscanthus lutarioriparius]|uniref:Protein kinase domain-containing protein n=1 Tax=Miscanthus lutarioriparius TaxID=422564 RepID=A0A811SNL4_9POAL|nr:unnamed protein product [Miscanthus lutarioriparius]